MIHITEKLKYIEKEVLHRLRDSKFRRGYETIVQVMRPLISNKYDSSQTILLTGSPRSGTTWVGEVACASEAFYMIVEPFDPERNPEIQKYGFNMNTYLPPNSLNLGKEQYMRDLFEGKKLTGKHLHHDARLTDLLKGGRFFVKAVRANRLLPWVESHSSLSTVLLIRHPCAVVASQLKFEGGWEDELRKQVESGEVAEKMLNGQHPYLPTDLLKKLDERLGGLDSRIQTLHQFLAFKWIGDVLIPLQHPSKNRHVATYEQFVVDGHNEIDRLFAHVDETASEAVYQRLDVPSATTQSYSNVSSGEDPLTTWRRTLSEKHVDQILSMVHDAGISFYDDGLMPDIDQLQTWFK